jgi:hypothetical protein
LKFGCPTADRCRYSKKRERLTRTRPREAEALKEYFNTVIDTLLERDVSELFAAMIIGLVFSMALAGLYSVLRRKAEDAVSVMVGLMMLACVVSATMASGYVRYKAEHEKITFTSTPAPPWPAQPWGPSDGSVEWRMPASHSGDASAEAEIARWHARRIAPPAASSHRPR